MIFTQFFEFVAQKNISLKTTKVAIYCIKKSTFLHMLFIASFLFDDICKLIANYVIDKYLQNKSQMQV